MARHIAYTCDVCGVDCSFETTVYGPLYVEVKGHKEAVYHATEVCGWKCAKRWMDYLAKYGTLDGFKKHVR